MRVLDLGAGTGDQTFPLARRVGPTGAVLATDISAGMLGVLRADASALGIANIETLVADASTADLRPQSFDAAVSVNCLQFVPAVDEALARARRALVPGRWLAAIVFSGPESNPYTAVPQTIIRRVGGLAPPDLTAPGVFALGAPGRFEALLGAAGFHDVEVVAVPIEWAFPSRAAVMEQLVTSPNQMSLLDQLDAGRRAEALVAVEDGLRQFERTDGVRIPGLALLGSGRA
jgi:SAM-dependent methyltransferase